MSHGAQLPLTPTQARRRHQLLRAARELTENSSYKAVTIAAVAERARTTRVTVYHYFTNKDHLLAEMALQWSTEVFLCVMRTPLKGTTVAKQVGHRLGELLRHLWCERQLVDSVIASFVSNEPGTVAATICLHGQLSLYLSSALKGHDFECGEDVERTIGHLFMSVLLGLYTGRLDLETGLTDLQGGLRLILHACD